MDNNRKEQNFWPGFVDALSNLVLTLVFVMVIFVLALFYLSSKVTQSKMDALCPATKVELEQVKKELEETRSALRAALAEAGQIKARVDVSEKKPAPITKNKVSTETSVIGSAIIIRFPIGLAELDDGAKEVLDKALAPILATGEQVKASLNAVPGPETYSEGKRLSFFRAVAIRNYLISKGVSKDSIESKMLDQGSVDPNDPDGRVVIKLQRAAK